MFKSKRGQGIFGMSYGAIFSIFVIIFIISVAYIAIKHFVGLNKCTQVGFFYDDLQKEVEKVWASGRHDSTYEGNIPASGLFGGDITHICFGRLNANTVPADSAQIKLELEDAFGSLSSEDDENVFIYPPKEACDGSMFAYELKCRNGNSDCLVVGDNQNTFFCEPINKKDGTVTVKLFYRSDVSPYVKLTDAT